MPVLATAAEVTPLLVGVACVVLRVPLALSSIETLRARISGQLRPPTLTHEITRRRFNSPGTGRSDGIVALPQGEGTDELVSAGGKFEYIHL